GCREPPSAKPASRGEDEEEFGGVEAEGFPGGAAIRRVLLLRHEVAQESREAHEQGGAALRAETRDIVVVTCPFDLHQRQGPPSRVHLVQQLAQARQQRECSPERRERVAGRLRRGHQFHTVTTPPPTRMRSAGGAVRNTIDGGEPGWFALVVSYFACHAP